MTCPGYPAEVFAAVRASDKATLATMRPCEDGHPILSCELDMARPVGKSSGDASRPVATERTQGEVYAIGSGQGTPWLWQSQSHFFSWSG